MISRTTRDFWRRYRRLHPQTRKLARKCYLVWRDDPRYPSLHFKKVGPRVWSARISDDFRAVAAPKAALAFRQAGNTEEADRLSRELRERYPNYACE